MSTSAKPPSQLRVERASVQERPIIDNFAQLYVYDFEPYVADGPEGEIKPDGRYRDDPHLDAYWREAGRVPYLFRLDGVPAGFALVNKYFLLKPPADQAMAEFFVHRRFRRRNLGQVAAHRIFAAHPGRWELSVLRENLKAQAFWRSTIERAAGFRDLQVTDESPPAVDGPIYRFTVS
jgi:predicted acetyltransferase